MSVNPDLLQKFPPFLREKFLEYGLDFPATTQFNYRNFQAYRAVERKNDDFSPITQDDFRSYYELKKKPKKRPRGIPKDPKKNPAYYGVSCFLDKEIVEQQMNFPNPNKKIAVGNVYSAAGPQNTNDKHVTWWLYEGADVSKFRLCK